MVQKDLAQALVAYREAREVWERTGTGVFTSGNYGNGDSAYPLIEGWRGWNLDAPAVRRGTGFLTIGELANVRKDLTDDPNDDGATDEYFRIDFGELEQPDRDFVKAVAQIVALGDWVTVRSQVFTVYGTLRGEVNDSITQADPEKQTQLRAADVDSRAIRFQETIDRLPVLLGKTLPVRIGERVISTYTDVRSD